MLRSIPSSLFWSFCVRYKAMHGLVASMLFTVHVARFLHIQDVACRMSPCSISLDCWRGLVLLVLRLLDGIGRKCRWLHRKVLFLVVHLSLHSHWRRVLLHLPKFTLQNREMALQSATHGRKGGAPSRRNVLFWNDWFRWIWGKIARSRSSARRIGGHQGMAKKLDVSLMSVLDAQRNDSENWKTEVSPSHASVGGWAQVVHMDSIDGLGSWFTASLRWSSGRRAPKDPCITDGCHTKSPQQRKNHFGRCEVYSKVGHEPIVIHGVIHGVITG